MTPKYMTLSNKQNTQSALGWYGQGDVGHSLDQLRAEGEDGVLL